MVEINKILFPCDLTESAPKILPYLLSVSEKYGATIHLLHVVEHTSLLSPLPYISIGLDQKKILEEAEKAVESFCDERMKGCPYFERKILSGDPAPAILQTIESENIDLVIMGSHGRKGLKDTIFGSVAENVVKKSPVPVLIINPHKVT